MEEKVLDSYRPITQGPRALKSARRERGASLVAYALLLSLIAGVSVGAVKNLGVEITRQYNKTTQGFEGAGAGTAGGEDIPD